jgi:hypothetical protein
MFKILLYALLATIFVSGPALVVSGLLDNYFHATLLDCNYRPGVLGRCDEMHYWCEIECFDRAGFKGGYSIVNEKPAAARWTHFGPHGPAFPVLCGTLARLFGWHAATAPLFNVGWLVVASIAWLGLVRPTLKQLAAAAFVVLTFWPCLLYIPATLQESVHCAVAIALAGLAHRSIAAGDRRTWPFLVLASMASLVRLTWALLLLIPVLAPGQRVTKTTRVIAFAMVPVLILIWRAIASPYPNFMESVMAMARQRPLTASYDFLLHAGKNLYALCAALFQPFSTLYVPSRAVPYQTLFEQPLQMVERYQVLLLIVIAALALLWTRASTRGIGVFVVNGSLLMLVVKTETGLFAGAALVGWSCWVRRAHAKGFYFQLVMSGGLLGLIAILQRDVELRIVLGRVRVFAASLGLLASLCLIHRDALGVAMHRVAPLFPVPAHSRPHVVAALNVALVAMATVCFYDVRHDRDFRVLAPHLLLSLLLLISSGAYRTGLGLAAIGLAAAPAFGVAFHEQHRHRFAAVEVIDLQPYLTFDDRKSPWENTLLVYDIGLEPILCVPAGFGVSTVVENEDRVGNEGEAGELLTAPKSRYLFMRAEEAAALDWVGLQCLCETQYGNLYLNLAERSE